VHPYKNLSTLCLGSEVRWVFCRCRFAFPIAPAALGIAAERAVVMSRFCLDTFDHVRARGIATCT
jgi:hypothetical protein